MANKTITITTAVLLGVVGFLFLGVAAGATPGTLAATPAIEEAPAIIKSMVDGFQDGNIPLGIGFLALLLALIIGAINAFLLHGTAVPDAIRKKILPWLVAGGGCLTAFGLALIADVGWGGAALAGLVTSAAAVGLWELVLKTVVRVLTNGLPK